MVELRELQLFELEILKEFARICEENQLKYYVAWGTLLGAVRHKGFIPWDDDIDVCMPYEDYKKFPEACKKSMGDKFYLQSRDENPENFISWMRIGVKDSTSIDLTRASIHMHWGIGIDIFPLFPYPSKKSQTKRRWHIHTLYSLMAGRSYYRLNASSQHGPKGLLYKALGYMPVSLNMAIFHWCERALGRETKYTTKYCIDYENDYDKYRPFKQSWFAKSRSLPFEDMKVMAPVGYDAYLKSTYGDYMTPPDEDNRGMHTDNPNVVVSLTESYTKYLK